MSPSPRSDDAVPATAGERVYRLLLHLYPRDFRHAHSAEMIDFYRQRRADLRLRGRGRLGLAREIGGDLCASVIRERRRQRAERPPHLETLLSDCRFAARALAFAPGFTLTVLVTLAVGMGATVGVFALVDEVILAPLPYDEPDRLVRVNQRNELYTITLSMADVLGVLEGQSSFEAFGAMRRVRLAVQAGASPEEAEGAAISAGVPAALGLRMAAGRGLAPTDNEPGAEPTTLISWALAGRLFETPEAAAGRSILLDGGPHTVIGVLPAGVSELAGVRGDIWPALELRTPGRRGPFGMIGIARLAAGVSLEAAGSELAAISERLFPLWADTFQDEAATLVAIPLRESLIGEVRTPMLALLGAVVLVLLISLANVANLVLARSAARRRELGVRAALGATRSRQVRLLVTEAMLLAMAGGVLATGVAAMIVRAFTTAAPRIPRLAEAAIDGGTLAAAGALSLGAGIVLGAIALVASKGALQGIGASRRGDDEAGRDTVRSALIVGEFALALPLLVGATLLMVSLLNLRAVPLGFDPDGRIAASMRLPAGTYADSESVDAYWQQAEAVLAAVPGVDGVGLMTGMPPDSPRWYNNFDLADRPVASGAPQPVSPWSQVAPGALAALGVPLLQGRTLEAGDDQDSAAVALVSESWARRFYPGESAVGREMYAGGCTADTCGSVTVVGVVGDVKFAGLDAHSEAVYTPFAQEPNRAAWIVVRTDRPTASLAPALTEALRSVDGGLPAPAWIDVRERVDAALATPRAWTLLLSAFASVAVLLAAVGIFGVLTYVVGRRRPEIGIRMALGADGRAVRRMVVRNGLTLAAIGTGMGLVLTIGFGRALESLLFEVGSGDPQVVAGTALGLLAIAAAASWLPARRAAATDAARIMREE